MWHRAAAYSLAVLLLTGCNDTKPEYREFEKYQSREELQNAFGSADFHQRSMPLADVVSLNDPLLIYPIIEQWAYDATRDGDIGKAVFSFYTNEQDTGELLRERVWLSEEAFSLRFLSDDT